MKLHLIDGTFELFRCWFGYPKSQTSAGREVGATRGLLRTMRSLLQGDDCTHVAVAFDHVIESFRNDLFDGYKTGGGIEPALLEQFPLAEEATRALGITTWPMVEFEADDALATASALFRDQVDQVVLCTPDKDLAQCVVGDHVVMLNRITKTVLNEKGVLNKFAIPPRLIPDYLALVGDSADGIPGIARWGAKSTSTVLSHFGGLEHIPDDEAAWNLKVRGRATLAANLRENRQQAMLYRRLATLRTDVPLNATFDDLRWNGADKARIQRFCQSIEDDHFLTRDTQFAQNPS